jgi:DNA-directed RNA polymerase subunit RPC12/RpoP
MSKIANMTGMRFGSLTVIKYVKILGERKAYWLCRCTCGKTKTILGLSLRNGTIVSCGGCVNGRTALWRDKELLELKYVSFSGNIRQMSEYWNTDGKTIKYWLRKYNIILPKERRKKKEYICSYCGKEFYPEHHEQYRCSNCKHIEHKIRSATRANITINNGYKKCSICGVVKELAEFCKNAHSTDGYNSSCKICKNSCRNKKREYERRKVRISENQKLALSIRVSHAIRDSFRRTNKSAKNNRHWENLVGFTLDELKEHLELQFHDGMSWEKFMNGSIHIDHIIPVSFFNFNSPDDFEFKCCWELTNLRPMWGADNISKGNKLP